MLAVLKRREALLILFKLISTLRTFADAKQFHSIMGPFTVKLWRTEQCPKDMQGRNAITYALRDVRTHHSQRVTYTGNINNSFYVDDDSGVKTAIIALRKKTRIMIGSWSNMGGWKDNAYIIKVNSLCRGLTTVCPKLWKAYVNNVLGEQLPCFYYPGIYRFVNFTVNMDHLGGHITQFIYGRWRADLQVFSVKTKEILGCTRAFADTIPI